MNSSFRMLLSLVALCSMHLGGVNATNYYGQVPSCISNFKYTDYDIFVGSKELKFTWTVTDAEKAENSYLYYYVADEGTLSWICKPHTSQEMQWAYEYAGNNSGKWYDDATYLEELYERDFYGVTYRTPSPLCYMREIEWDGFYPYKDNLNENRVKMVNLSSGELDFGTITRGKCVFFMFRDGEDNTLSPF